MLDLTEYTNSHKKEIIDFVEDKISKEKNKGLKTKGQMFDRLVNTISNDMAFGPTADMAHIVLANAIIYSLWCGWFSQAMVNKKEEKFSAEYVEKFQKAIMDAFKIGQKYSTDRP